MASGELSFSSPNGSLTGSGGSASLCSRLESAGTFSIEEPPHLLHQRIILVLPAPNPGLEGLSLAAWGLAFLGTLPESRDPVGELITQVLKSTRA